MISIIVPVFNTSEYLNKCVESLIGQTYTNIEILLVDDGSTDSSGQICDEWASKDSRVRVIHKENGGLVSSWKRGVIESHGDYLMFVDSDDWVDTNMLEEMVSFCTPNNSQNDSLEIISSDYVIERTLRDGSFSQEYVYQKLTPGVYDRAAVETEVIPKLLGNEKRFVTISRCMKLISRGLVIDNLDYADEKIRMAEDSTIMLPSLMDCQRLVIMDHKAYYHYLLIQDSMVHKYDRTMYDNFSSLVNICRRIITDKTSSNPELCDLLNEHLQKEHLLWLLLCVKNEARGNKEGYRKNIRTIYKEQRELITKCKISVEELSNKLLYRTLKQPDFFRLSVLRLAMRVYYR